MGVAKKNMPAGQLLISDMLNRRKKLKIFVYSVLFTELASKHANMAPWLHGKQPSILSFYFVLSLPFCSVTLLNIPLS